MPSYFEILTGAALTWFADVAVEAAVVEVGLGGTWDATNVVDGDVAVVTNVSIDHVDYLGLDPGVDRGRQGRDREARRSMLVLGETDPALVPLFLAREPAQVLLRERDFGITRNDLAARRPGRRPVHAAGPLRRGLRVAPRRAPGRQRRDRGCRGRGVRRRPAVRRSWSPTCSDACAHPVGSRWSATGRSCVLDGAHNVAGAQAFARAMADEFPAADRTLVVGLLREKDPTEMLEALGARDAARLVCCAPPSARARDPQRARRRRRARWASRRIASTSCTTSPTPSTTRSRRRRRDGQIVVTGSLYVVGAARVALGVSDSPRSGRVSAASVPR